jgi:hypothetical protein
LLWGLGVALGFAKAKLFQENDSKGVKAFFAASKKRKTGNAKR